ncbi:MAG: flagellar hook capping FlgD N-terminal domain-containing protein [Pirellulaceae bacterium]
MSRVPNVGAGSSTTPDAGPSKGIQDLDLNSFIDLMIAELQNQDPLNPIDNSQMLQQITQIREIGSSDKLSQTLDSVLLGQNLTTASSLIGKQVSALSDTNGDVEGIVDKVSVDVDDDDNRSIKIHIGGDAIKLKNIRSVVETGA